MQMFVGKEYLQCRAAICFKTHVFLCIILKTDSIFTLLCVSGFRRHAVLAFMICFEAYYDVDVVTLMIMRVLAPHRIIFLTNIAARVVFFALAIQLNLCYVLVLNSLE